MSALKKTLKFAQNAATVVANAVAESANEIQETKKKYEKMPDDEIIDIIKREGFFSSSPKEKGVAFSVLKRRGYTSEDLENLRGG